MSVCLFICLLLSLSVTAVFFFENEATRMRKQTTLNISRNLLWIFHLYFSLLYFALCFHFSHLCTLFLNVFLSLFSFIYLSLYLYLNVYLSIWLYLSISTSTLGDKFINILRSFSLVPFGFVIFWRKNIGIKKSLVKCWWNGH